MNLRLVSAALFLAIAILFFLLGYQSTPRNVTFMLLGLVFAIFSAIRFRSSRRQ